MELTDERAHHCLKYVDSVQRHGYKLTILQFNAFAKRPVRRPAQRVTTSALDAVRDRLRQNLLDVRNIVGGRAAPLPAMLVLDQVTQ